MKKKLHLTKKFLKLFILIISSLFFISILQYALIDDTLSYTRILMKEMYEQNKIDSLFIGSSHAYRSINPEIFDQEWNENTFNLGTSSQTIEGTYYLLKECMNNTEVNKVFLEVYHSVLGKEIIAGEALTKTFIISDYMKPSWNKVNYLYYTVDSDNFINAFILPRREWMKLFDLEYIVTLFEVKSADAYNNYEYIRHTNEEYLGKGFVFSYETLNPDTMFRNESLQPLNDMIIPEYNMEYLNKIVELCANNNIELTLFVAPMPEFTLVDIGNYDKYIEYMTAFAQNNNFNFYDFNLVKPNYLSLDNTDFKDYDHLNGKGADKFSKFFAKFYLQYCKEDDIFYHSFEERISNQEEQIYGLILSQEANCLNIKPITNSRKEIVYSVSVLKEDGTKEILQDKSSNTIIPYTKEYENRLEIWSYFKNNNNLQNYVIY